MSVKMSAKWALLSVFLILISTNSMAEEGQGISLKWDYQFPSRITAIIADDWNNDNSTDIIVAASKSIYILNSDGSLERKYDIDSNGEIYALAIGNIDNKTGNEILVGTGFMLRERSNETRFEFTGTEATKKTRYLYETIRNKGGLYCIRNDEITELSDIGEWVRAIRISDLDNNGTNEIIVGTGGANTDWMMEYGEWTETICVYHDRPGFDTQIYNCSETHHNASWHRVSYNMNNGSVYILTGNGSILRRYTVGDAVWGLSTSDLFYDRDEEIVAGSGNEVYELDKDLKPLWSYPLDGVAKKIEVSDIDRNGNKVIIVEFMATNVNGIALIEREGRKIWDYRVKGDIIRDFYIKNIDLDKEKEILVASPNKIYVVDKDGSLKREFWVPGGIEGILSTDLNNDSYPEIIIASGDTLYDYEISKRGIIEQNATIYYSLAEKNYERGDYQKAGEFIRVARVLYSEINDSEGISNCDSLLKKVEEGINKGKLVEAQSLYNRAIMRYTLNDYPNARMLAERARHLYIEIGDSGGIEMCSSLIEDIDRAGGLDNITSDNITSTTIINSTTSILIPITPITIAPIDKNKRSLEFRIYSFLGNRDNALIVIEIGVVLLIIFLDIRHRYFKKKREMKARIGEGWGEKLRESKEETKPEPEPEKGGGEKEKEVESGRGSTDAKEEPKTEEPEPEEKVSGEDEKPVEDEKVELPETPELSEELEEIDREFQERFGNG